MNEQPKTLLISIELASAIEQYLMQQPHAGAHKLIAALQQLQPAPEAPPKMFPVYSADGMPAGYIPIYGSAWT